ncbi:hypothetical protein A2V82_00625 [candidate division KSB1 bacterium RBG_16_48_16]|nr:MAG: hypothetical protein A2V82_00625 [candidate division KSB1 bacterium RBG_16_48_16]
MHKRSCIKATFLILFGACLLSCAGTGSWGSKINWGDFSLESLPTQQDYPDHEAVILLDDGSLMLDFKETLSRSVLKRHQIIKILNRKGYPYANVTIPYSSSTKIRNIKARTISPDGEIFLLDEKKIYDITLYPDFIFYSDVRAKRFSFPAEDDGCILEMTWEKHIASYSYWDYWQFQYDIPVLISRYSLFTSSKWPVSWRTIGVEAKPEEIYQGSNIKKYKWELHDIEPFVAEEAMPPLDRVVASVLFSPPGIESWDDFASWYHSLIKGRLQPNAETAELAHRLTDPMSSEREKLQHLYEFVRDKIRYVAIEIGIGGYQPHFAHEVQKNRYGDCKDKVILLCALAQAIGMDVRPVIISTAQNGKVDTTVTSHTLFNHVIARAVLPDSSEIWMDATDSYCPFDDLPWYDQNRLVIEIKHDGGKEWLTTPFSIIEKNAISKSWMFQIDSLYNCLAQAEFTYDGNAGLEMRHRLGHLSVRDRTRWLMADLQARFPYMDSIDIVVENIDDLQSPVSIKSTFSWKLPVATAGAVQFNLDDFCQFQLNRLFFESKRHFPIELPFPYTTADVIKVRLPDNLEFSINLRNNFLNESFGDYQLRYFQDERFLKINRHFALRQIDIPAADYDDFRGFLANIAQLDKSFFLVKKPGAVVLP